MSRNFLPLSVPRGTEIGIRSSRPSKDTRAVTKPLDYVLGREQKPETGKSEFYKMKEGAGGQR